jgi:hypothetical protein
MKISIVTLIRNGEQISVLFPEFVAKIMLQ